MHNVSHVKIRGSTPRYELRALRGTSAHSTYEVSQLPTPASPHAKDALRIAGLRDYDLNVVKHLAQKWLPQVGISIDQHENHITRNSMLTEDVVPILGLLFRTPARRRSRANIRTVTKATESMGREKTAFWMGMAMHRQNPRRVLTALRYLLTEPKRCTETNRQYSGRQIDG